MNVCSAVKNIYNMINLWCMSNLYLEGKIMLFKFLAVLKIVMYVACLTITPKCIVDLRYKIKHGTLCNNHKNGSLKNVDIELKIKWNENSFKCLWIFRCFNEFHHD